MTTGDAHMERSPRFISMVRMAKNAETASTLVITSASISSRRASLASARLRRRQESFELVIVIVLSVAHRRPRTKSLLVDTPFQTKLHEFGDQGRACWPRSWAPGVK